MTMAKTWQEKLNEKLQNPTKLEERFFPRTLQVATFDEMPEGMSRAELDQFIEELRMIQEAKIQ